MAVDARFFPKLSRRSGKWSFARLDRPAWEIPLSPFLRTSSTLPLCRQMIVALAFNFLMFLSGIRRLNCSHQGLADSLGN